MTVDKSIVIFVYSDLSRRMKSKRSDFRKAFPHDSGEGFGMNRSF